MTHYMHGSTPESRKRAVEYFCSICDHYKEKNCNHRFSGVRSVTDQERYAERGFCGWASVGGLWASIICNEEEGEIVKFHDGKTVKREEITRKS